MSEENKHRLKEYQKEYQKNYLKEKDNDNYEKKKEDIKESQ